VQSVLGALTSPIRREILWRIWDDEQPAGTIAVAVRRAPATVSEHLAVLREAGLVTVRRVGNRRLYRAVTDAVQGLPERLADESARWTPAANLPPPGSAVAQTWFAAVAGLDVGFAPETVFAAFTDGDLFSHWLGAPVELDDGWFSCTLAWGTQVRGRYEHVLAPSLIAMRWDFDDDRVPLPGRELVSYLRIDPAPGGAHVEVHQLVGTAEQTEFMQLAWTFVLGRLEAGLAAALGQPARGAAGEQAQVEKSG